MFTGVEQWILRGSLYLSVHFLGFLFCVLSLVMPCGMWHLSFCTLEILHLKISCVIKMCFLTYKIKIKETSSSLHQETLGE